MHKDNQYNQIFQVWKNERQTNNLLEVKSVLYSTIRQKISSLEKELNKLDKKDTISFKIISERIERLNKMLKDLTKLRMHKIIHGILNGNLSVNDLAAEEIDLLKNLEGIFDDHNQRSILGKAISNIYGEDFSKSEDIEELMTVRILEDIPAIIAAATNKDSTKKTFGPFKKEDIVRLPLVYAKTLIMKNAADRVDLPNL
ncbi:MAG: DNA replication complex GINS family protein [Candidatus Heimdallarchaeota archaeon]|nr:DNA replication complex GINS family protein [Candidatus Heimdallarchaeota archaeon]